MVKRNTRDYDDWLSACFELSTIEWCIRCNNQERDWVYKVKRSRASHEEKDQEDHQHQSTHEVGRILLEKLHQRAYLLRIRLDLWLGSHCHLVGVCSAHDVSEDFCFIGQSLALIDQLAFVHSLVVERDQDLTNRWSTSKFSTVSLGLTSFSKSPMPIYGENLTMTFIWL